MSGNKETPSDPLSIDFSEDEKVALRALIQEKIKHTDMANSMSVGSLFNNLELYPLPHLPYSQANILAWNQWLHEQKEGSIGKVRSNAANMPPVYLDVFHGFLRKLITLGLLTQSTETLDNMHKQLIAIIDEK